MGQSHSQSFKTMAATTADIEHTADTSFGGKFLGLCGVETLGFVAVGVCRPHRCILPMRNRQHLPVWGVEDRLVTLAIA